MTDVNRMRKRLVAALVGCVIVSAIVFAPQWLSFEQFADRYQDLKAFADAHLIQALIGFWCVYVLVVALSIPAAAVLTLGGAALFGWAALPVIVLAASIGASLVFMLARSLLKEMLATRVSHWIEGVESRFKQSPVRWCLTMRLIPVLPFWAANIIPALLGMRLVPFLYATAAGILPGTAIYVGLGQGLDHVFQQGSVPDLTILSAPEVWGPLLALAILSALSTRFGGQHNASSEH
jgi:uncharacterized membrane protein YdjX (TVP38/TMEM64 family)